VTRRLVVPGIPLLLGGQSLPELLTNGFLDLHQPAARAKDVSPNTVHLSKIEDTTARLLQPSERAKEVSPARKGWEIFKIAIEAP